MKRPLLLAAILTVEFPGLMSHARSQDLEIGGTPVKSKVVDGKITGDKWIVVSNTLIRVRAEATPIAEPPGAPQKADRDEADSGPDLHLVMKVGTGSWSGKYSGAKGLHGFLYMAGDWKTPDLIQTNLVDILSSEDKSRIVVMIRHNGPIYTTTNSGMSWKVTDQPGTYRFRLTGEPDGGGMFAKATLVGDMPKQIQTGLPNFNWYVAGAGADGGALVLTGDPAHPAPALSIKRADATVVVSWPSTFTGFGLQQNNDLHTTNWSDVTNTIEVVGDENQTVIKHADMNNFYRLKSLTP